MIAGGMTMPAPAPASAPRSASSARDSAAPAVASARAERPDAPPVTGTAPIEAGGRQDAGKATDGDGRESDFDALLSDASAPAATGGSQIPIVPPTAGSATTGPAAAPAEPVSPEHLLALLDGRWAQPVPPTSAPTVAPPLASGSLTLMGENPLSTTGASAAATAAALPMPGVLEGRAADLAGRMTEFAESSLVRDAASTEPAPLTAPPATSATSVARSPLLVQTTPIPLPADPDAGFDDAFGSRITWMAEQRMGHAEIRVTPDHAGPIDVRLQLDGTRVSADFQSTNPEVRQALEASMARLREMLEQQGLQLAHAGVGNGHPDRRGAPDMSHGHDPSRDAELDPRMSATPIIRSTRGLLDEYA